MAKIQDEQKVNQFATMRWPVLTNGFWCESAQHNSRAVFAFVEKCQLACKPGFVCRAETTQDDHSSGTFVAKCFTQPTRAAGPEKPDSLAKTAPPLFGLAPGGVCPATPIAGGAVRSCRTFSPLPEYPAVRSLWHFP
jgi:hypothetical protein